MRPVIGITTSTHTRDHEAVPRIACVNNQAYSQAVYQAGGLPVLLPGIPAPDDAGAILARCDGLILSGGGDVDPAYWGEAPHPRLGTVDRARDALEMALLAAALRRDLPVLGICRGIQVMAVAGGGDLWQDIPTQVPHNVGHYRGDARDEAVHPVTIAADSLLARILGLEPATPDGITLQVNSFHHQAARRCGPTMTPVAWSGDALIEALVLPDAAFALGVQWHPEDLAADDSRQARLFSALIDAARRASR